MTPSLARLILLLPAPCSGRSRQSNSVGMEFVLVPAGSFTMAGSPPSGAASGPGQCDRGAVPGVLKQATARDPAGLRLRVPSLSTSPSTK